MTFKFFLWKYVIFILQTTCTCVLHTSTGYIDWLLVLWEELNMPNVNRWVSLRVQREISCNFSYKYIRKNLNLISRWKYEQKRNPNLTEIELQTPLDEVKKQKSLLFTNVATNAAKKRAWENICTKINSWNAQLKKSWRNGLLIRVTQRNMLHRYAAKKGEQAEDLQLMSSLPSRQSRHNNRNHS